jgi:hypothetical protein
MNLASDIYGNGIAQFTSIARDSALGTSTGGPLKVRDAMIASACIRQ